MSKIIIAIDPGVSMGWAVSIDGKVKDYGTWVFEGEWPERLSSCSCKIVGTMENNLEVISKSSRHVVIEKMFDNPGPSRPALKLLQRYIGVLMAAASDFDCDVHEVGTTTWKKSLGKGNMGKDEVRKAVKMVWGIDELPQTDAADALGMLWWAQGRV